MRNNKWTSEDMPSLEGKNVIVTGANSGLGFEGTKKFAEKGANVVMACRSMEKGRNAKEKIREETERGSLDVKELDLASLDSVESFAENFRSDYDELHVLCNNAGMMAIPRQETEDGFEKQLGVNHLGHFRLTSELVGMLESTEGETRVVNQSSAVHENGEINFDDLMLEEQYDKWDAYAQSKLANILFTHELDRRLKESDGNVKAVSCHPGYASTNLQYRGPEEEGSKLKYFAMKIANTVVAQSAEKGALPMLYAATSEEIEGGEYIGPGGFKNMRGYPKKQKSAPQSYDKETEKKLWGISEDLTDAEYEV